ncbi:MAG: alpha/beta fold hydrolase [Verrucomicrobiota bacterium]
MKTPVLLVHGIWDTGKKFKRLKSYLEERGYEVVTVDLKPNTGKASLAELAKRLDEFVNKNFPSHKFDIIAFSMGGLVSRHYLQYMDGASRVNRFISISSPHHGTFTANVYALVTKFFHFKGVPEMCWQSRFVRKLNSDASCLRKLNFTSLWTPWDLMIVPSFSSVHPDAYNIRIFSWAHPLMLWNKNVFRIIENKLSEK